MSKIGKCGLLIVALASVLTLTMSACESEPEIREVVREVEVPM